VLSSTQRQGSHTEGGRLSAFDLLVLPSLDQLIFKFKILFSFFTKQATLERSAVLNLPPQLVFPDKGHEGLFSFTLLVSVYMN
jgi:hypothetical protein